MFAVPHDRHRAFRRAPSTRLTIGLVAGDEFAGDLACEANVLRLRPGDVARQIDNAHPPIDFILLAPEPQLPHADELFGAAFAGEISRCARAKEIPVVFWHLDDAATAPLYRHAAGIADLLCAWGAKAAGAYRKADFGRTEATVLPPAIQPTIANPYRILKDSHPGDRRGIVAADGLQAAGAVHRHELFEPQRNALAAVVRCGARSAPVSACRSLIEAAACGALPILAGEGAEDILLPEGTAVCRTEAELRDIINAIEEDAGSLDWRKRGHLAWRSVFHHHTFANRLHSIAEALGIRSGWQPYPFVTVFVPTYRLHLVDHCVERYRVQNYPETELIVVLHTNEDIEETRRRVEMGNRDVRVLRMPTDVGVGGCMNLAFDVARGSHALKMDDDDFYGENYVLDMMLPLRAVNADVFGKPPRFVYFEADGKVYRRIAKAAVENIVTDGTALAKNRVRISGSTHSGRVEALRAIRFPLDEVGAADTSFYGRCAEHDLIVGIWDGFSNLTFRSADKTQHTWRLADEAIQKNAVELAGRGKEDILQV